MIWLTVISTLSASYGFQRGYVTTFQETNTQQSCEAVIRAANTLRPGKVEGMCIRIEK